MGPEEELTRTLEAMKSLWVATTGTSHPHLETLLNPGQRQDPRTRNYLASGASGTLRDRIFHPLNGDRVTAEECTSLNERYRGLVAKATLLSVEMNLPATADWTAPPHARQPRVPGPTVSADQRDEPG